MCQSRQALLRHAGRRATRYRGVLRGKGQRPLLRSDYATPDVLTGTMTEDQHRANETQHTVLMIPQAKTGLVFAIDACTAGTPTAGKFV